MPWLAVNDARISKAVRRLLGPVRERVREPRVVAAGATPSTRHIARTWYWSLLALMNSYVERTRVLGMLTLPKLTQGVAHSGA